MARLVVLFVVVVGLTAGAASEGGAAVSSQRSAAGFACQSASFPSWSPDGKQILFGCSGKQGRIVRTSSRPGGAIHPVHTGSYPQFWAPDGRIVFGLTNWHSVDVHGGKAKPVFFPFSGPHPDSCLQCSPDTWAILSPNREYAAVTMDAGADNPPPPEFIALLKLRPGHSPVEIHTPLDGAAWDLILSFSPQGRQLIFIAPTGLMAYRLGSSAPAVPLAQSGIPGASLVPSDAQEVQWSPDGRWVAFVEGQGLEKSLEVVPTTGATAPRVLPNCPGPGQSFLRGFSWSPASNLIAYDCLSNLILDGSELLTVRPDGTHLTDLLKQHDQWMYVNELGGEPEPAQWSPDGSRLLFLASQAYTGSASVFTIRPNGHGLSRLG